MADPLDWADDLGPEKVIHLHDDAARLTAVVVIDNTAAGAFESRPTSGHSKPSDWLGP